MTLADQTATTPTPFVSTRASEPERPPEPREQPQRCGINVGADERKVSVVAGGALALLGLSRRSLPGLALAALGGAIVYRGVSGHCHVYEALGIDTHNDDDGAPPEPSEYFEHGIHVEHAITIDKPRHELFAFWRNFENLPRFMRHLESVKVIDEKRSHWVARGPAGMCVEWDAEIINEEPNELIAWRSLGGADVDSAGSVRFLRAPDDRGTQLRVVLDYIPPAGRVGKVIAELFGEEPKQQISADLRRFKQLMECGEVPTIEGQPRGRCS
jgi:uncharacterized membrane protein